MARIRMGGRFRTQQIVQKMRKIGAATIFLDLFVFFTYQTVFPNSTNSTKIAKNCGRNDL